MSKNNVAEKEITGEVKERVELKSIVIAGHEYYDLDNVAEAFELRRYRLITTVRDEQIACRRIGNQYLISADSLHVWLSSGKMEKQEYKSKNEEEDEASTETADEGKE